MQFIFSVIAGIVIVIVLAMFSFLGIYTAVGIILGLLIYCSILLYKIYSRLTEDDSGDDSVVDLRGNSVQEAVAKHMLDREARGIK